MHAIRIYMAVCEDMPLYRKLFKIVVKLNNRDVFGV